MRMLFFSNHLHATFSPYPQSRGDGGVDRDKKANREEDTGDGQRRLEAQSSVLVLPYISYHKYIRYSEISYEDIPFLMLW